MPVSITYSLPAASCPSLPYRSSPIKPATATGSSGGAVAPVFATGGTTGTAKGLNQEGMLLEALGSVGAGGYAVAYGLALSDSGTALTLAVSAGQALIDAPVNYDTAGTIALSDNAYNWIYLLQNGTLTKTSAATATPVPANPATTCVFLGRVQVSAGAITSIDYSGRVYLVGGVLHRQTGDTGTPGDTPPAQYHLRTLTAAGTFVWNGTAYEPLPMAGYVSLAMTDANYTLAAANYYKSTLGFTGTLTAARQILLPNIAGQEYTIYNGTTGGFALTALVAGQTGVSIPNGRRLIVYCDGTDYRVVQPPILQTADIAANAITTALLANAAVGTTQIANAAVTAPLLATAVSTQVSGASTVTVTGATSPKTVTVQLVDVAGNNLARSVPVDLWLSDSGAAMAVSATAPSGGVSFTAGTVVKTYTANLNWQVISDATGKVTFTVTQATAYTWQVRVAWKGELYSAVLAF